MKGYRFLFIGLMFVLIMAGCSKAPKIEKLNLRYHKGKLYYASSELQNPDPYQLGKYSAYNLFDRDKNTCWAEGKDDDGVGEFILFQIDESVDDFVILNGFAGTNPFFQKNNRVKEMELSIYVGANKPGEASEIFTIYNASEYPEKKKIVLKDVKEAQRTILSLDWEDVIKFKEKVKATIGPELKYEYFIKLVILSIYKGSQYNDTCLSDIIVKGGNEEVEKVYVNDTENTLLLDTFSEKGIILEQDETSVFQILETSKNKEWAIIIRMPAEADESRAETEYYLYNTVLRKKVDSSILPENVGPMNEFEETENNIYLKFTDKKTAKEDSIELMSIREKLEN
ncbi:MAG: hypothetical protein KKH98_11515 [Spirochaetes bacterium]|nr:hypothetical protein [Spirochaetota bacterium]